MHPDGPTCCSCGVKQNEPVTERRVASKHKKLVQGCSGSPPSNRKKHAEREVALQYRCAREWREEEGRREGGKEGERFGLHANASFDADSSSCCIDEHWVIMKKI